MITTAQEFKRLRESSNPEEYRRAALEETSGEVWREIVETMPDLRFWVAQNKTVPVEILELLAASPDVEVRSMVARKRKISEPIAILLAGDSDETVRAGLASNAKLPDSALNILRNDRSPLVQNSLAIRNKNG